MEIKRTLLKSLVACLVLSVSTVASADAIVHIEMDGGPTMNPGETKTCNVILDFTSDPIMLYEISAKLDAGSGGAGVVFDQAGSTTLMEALKLTVEYVFVGDWDGPLAVVSDGGTKLKIGDLALNNTHGPPATLASFAVTADPDPLVSAGVHQISNTGDSAVAGVGYFPPAPLFFQDRNDTPFEFVVTPEPATLSVLALGGLGMMIRRRRR